MSGQRERWITIGRLGRPHGVRGEIRVWPLNHDTALLAKGRTLNVGQGKRPDRTLTLKSVRWDAKGPVIQLAEVMDRDAAEALTGLTWFEQRDAFPDLADDEIYVVDLIGMAVVTEDGHKVGKLTDVWQSGAHDTYVVKDGPKEHLIPVVDEFICRVDTDNGQIVIRPVEGLLDGGE